MYAARYAVCRRQFQTIKGSEEERKLLDYQLHMDTICKQLSNAITINQVMQDLIKLEGQSQREISNGSFKLLDILHHFSSGMKALGTDMVYVGIDELRQACGGAGFLMSSGIADLWGEQAPFPTFEGVNVIMYQQSSRMLLKQVAKVLAGKTPNEFFAYLSKMNELLSGKSTARSTEEFLEHDHLQRALATNACYLVKKVYTMLSESKASSKTKQNELFAMDVNRMTKAHLIYICYERACKSLMAKKVADQNIKKAFMNLYANFALKQLSLDCVSLYETGFFGPGSNDLLLAAYKQTLIEMRPNVIGLVELLPEGSYATSIGNKYGDIYEAQYEIAKNSRLNNDGVPDLYYTHIKPVMQMVPTPKL